MFNGGVLRLVKGDEVERDEGSCNVVQDGEPCFLEGQVVDVAVAELREDLPHGSGWHAFHDGLDPGVHFELCGEPCSQEWAVRSCDAGEGRNKAGSGCLVVAWHATARPPWPVI